MAKINLKNILSQKSDVAALIVSLIEKLNADVYIEDIHQKNLLGTGTTPVAFEEAIKIEEDIAGWVKGDDKVTVIASLLNLLIQKEVERKKLGNEVLILYQEVNLIFNFSEKLAQTIGQKFYCQYHVR